MATSPAVPDPEPVPRTEAIRLTARDRLDFDDLRPGQKDAVQSVVAGHDTLVVLPTGSGKSAIYQLAAELRDGPAVVISPLIALQQDQVRGIADHDVGEAAEANSTLTDTEKQRRLEAFRDGELRFLFLAPEQLRGDTLEALAATDLALFVVDEAHCISDWGHDFRPAYLRLGAVVDALGHPPVLALTATAAPPVREEIARRLHMDDPTVVVRGIDRPNIHLAVRRFQDDEVRRRALVDAVHTADPPGIVYVATRRAAERHAAVLRETGLRAAHYHGGMPADARREAHEAFIDDRLDVIVATPAFGMGIDKPNVRFVFHASAPESLDTYYQEVGRAGRDGAPASAVLLHRDEDLGLRTWFTATGGIDESHLAALAGALVDRDGDGVRVDDLVEVTALTRTTLLVAMTRLEEQGVLRLTADDRIVRTAGLDALRDAVDAATEELDARDRYERSRLEMVRAYADTDRCRGRYLVNYYGEEMADVCGHCDNCDEHAGGDEVPEEVPFPLEARVRHPKWGDGTVVRYEQDRMTVLFDEAGYRTLGLEVVRDKDLLTPA